MANILPVPESEQRVLDNLIRDLNETYPDKIIVRLQQDHKKWYEKVTRLYKNIGYASRDEFLAAYGFTEVKGKNGRPSADLNAIIEELISRYQGDRYADSIDQVKADNPDIAPKLKNISNKSKDLFGMSLNNYLKEKGVLKSDKSAAEERNKEYKEKLEDMFAELRKRYEGKDLPKTLIELKESNADIENIANIGPWIERVFERHGTDYLIEQGLMQKKEKKEEKPKAPSLSVEEKLAQVTEELKKRVSEDGKCVRATNGKEITENLKALYPDLPIQTIDNWVKKVHPGKNIKSYLIEQGIIQTAREYFISRIKHVDSINFSKDKLYLEEDDPDVQILLQNIGKGRALVTGLISASQAWQIRGCYFVLDTDDKNPMKGIFWDTFYLEDYDYVDKFISKANVLEILDKKAGKKPKSKSVTAGDNPVEAFCLENFNPSLYETFLKRLKVSDKHFKSVKYKDSEKMAPAFVVECAVVPYMQQLTTIPTKIGDYQKGFSSFGIVPAADKVAEALDLESFGEMLDKLLGKDMPSVYHTLVPYGRYASGKQISGLAARMNKWRKWDEYSATGRKSIIVARGAILLNDSREAMLYADKAGILDRYARIRGMDTDVMRDHVMSDFGLDKNGNRTFDLGNTTVEVSVNSELKLNLYDTAASKEVKSIPKRGADPDKYEQVKAEFADIKKNLKDIVKNRTELLFDAFLSGKTRKPDSWKNSYLNNYILHKVGELVVWDQKGKTFILTEDGVIDCNGDAYDINDKDSIGVAHPMYMNPGEAKAWQKYFTSHGLKQPFEQVWEPVIDMDRFKPNRYEGRMIPYYKFLKKEKHGISVYDYNFHNEIDIRFADCDAWVNRVDWGRHSIDMNDRFEVKEIKIKRATRVANHVIAYLDKITAIDRIIADDTTFIETLHDCSLAQITDYINVANENNAINVLAALMDYKNDNFADFDPMDEFILD